MRKLFIHDNHLGQINAYPSGNIIDLAAPTPAQISIEDIAHALSNVCRFGGHCSPFYSVAQHSVLVAALAPQELKFAALLHDAPEAYLGDVIKPLKVLLKEHYSTLEARFEYAIGVKYQIDPEHLLLLKAYDRQALDLETAAFQDGNTGPLLAVLSDHFLLNNGWAWNPPAAEQEFLIAFQELYHPERNPVPVMFDAAKHENCK